LNILAITERIYRVCNSCSIPGIRTLSIALHGSKTSPLKRGSHQDSLTPSCWRRPYCLYGILLAIRLNKPTELQSLLPYKPDHIGLVGKDGFTGLQLACKYGFLPIVQILIDKGATVNDTDLKYKRTCVHWAAMCGHTDIVLYLARESVQFCDVVNRVDFEGHTALMLASRSGRLETVRLLLQAGARTDIFANNGRTVFNMCNGSRDVEQALSSISPRAEFSNGSAGTTGIQWGISTGVLLAKSNASKFKLITNGWLKRKIEPLNAAEASSTCNTPINEVIVKLNKAPRELQREVDVRARITGTPLESSVVPVSHPAVLQTPDMIWHAILLEKGIIDLHHLYDAMCQGATCSRLQEVKWRATMAAAVSNICLGFVRQGLVWYDLKPSNFIICPKPCVSDAEAAPSSAGGNAVADSNPQGARYGTESPQSVPVTQPAIPAYQHTAKTHLWLQHSHWEPSDYSIKAADLCSVHPSGSTVPKSELSCTAKFMSPALAEAMRDPSVVNVTASPADMLWSLAMTVLQLLHCENKTFYAVQGIAHSEDVYTFLTQSHTTVCDTVESYIRNGLVAQLQEHAARDRIVECLCKIIRWSGNTAPETGDALQALIDALHSTAI
jgi:ankyrin repeat protein